MLQAGSTINVKLTVTPGSILQTQASIVAQAQGILSQSNILTNGATTQSASWVDQLSNAVFTSFSEAPFQVSMNVVADQDYNQPEDLLSIVINAFYQASGNVPSGSVVSVSAPGSAAPSLTPQGSSFLGGIGDSLGSAINQITNAGWTLIAIVVGLIILILILFAFKPNFGKGIGAVAGSVI